MNRPIILFLGILTFVFTSLSSSAEETVSAADKTVTATTPKQVQKALAWDLPKNNCAKPKLPGQRKQIFDSQGVSREEWDVDYYTVKRYKRKEQRWERCVDNYKADLKKSFITLKASAQYGLTKPQAAVILGKMKSIQTVLQDSEGRPPELQVSEGG